MTKTTPDEVLADIRLLSSKLLDWKEEYGSSKTAGKTAGLVLASRIRQLDVWLTAGGHRPKDWAAGAVNLNMPGQAEAIYAELDKVRLLLTGSVNMLKAKSPQVLMTVGNLLHGHPDVTIAALVSHIGEDTDPLEAARKLVASVAESLDKVGKA